MTEWLANLADGMSSGAWIVLISALANVACALVGTYFMLRRMSLLSDAVAHAVLPGLVLAFVWSGSLGITWMMLGAGVVGLLTTVLSQALARSGGVAADAGMGIVFTTLFALGVVLLNRYAKFVDLDPDCVFQGQLALMPEYRVTLGGISVPRALLTTTPILLVNLVVVLLLWKELKISSFDAELATTMGFRASWVHYLLMVLTAATSVASFEAVGSILVVAMFIVPGAVAHLVCDRLSTLLATACGVAVAVAALGYAGAVALDADPAGMMAVAAGLVFVTAVVFAPRYGALSKLIHNTRIAGRIVREDLLAMLFRLEELHVSKHLAPHDAYSAMGGGVQPRWQLWRLMRGGLVRKAADTLELTEAGRRRAAQLVRSHRLWEAYLVQFLGLPLDHVHAPAERMEHFISPRLEEQIVAGLDGVEVDPHGREIPTGGK